MKRLAIKKLIVISQSESRSLEVPFENGLNIILGKFIINKKQDFPAFLLENFIEFFIIDLNH